ncbi:hypothetical protein BCV70DRAFT_235873 [Testicularia cyperi]|uniref:Inositol-1-monophosphatase n=1 Tax=Testicularia cyperi TaxID=1882483 RepID=A0A317XVG7_9BASI|nr:hypothetical protein BCV70DRAFT_235873 [Testicularia cyperi]
MVSASELEEIHTFAVELAKKAGAAIIAGSSKRFESSAGFDEKKNTADLVTETDQATEELVKREISTKYPDHDFIGEESWAAGQEGVIGDKITWIVDPIDGTTNFVHGFPYTCISVGVVVGKKPAIGVVYAPFLEYLYSARTGNGAFLSTPQSPTPRRLPLAKPQPLPSLRQALIAFEWGSDRRKHILDQKLNSFAKITGDPDSVGGGKMCQGVRSMGSAALNFSNVAAGNIDLYWEIGCWAWDVCAGVVIAQEAGCAVVGSKKAAAEAAQGSSFNDVTPELLTGRKYVVVRAISPGQNESETDAQKRILNEFYGCVDEWDP